MKKMFLLLTALPLFSLAQPNVNTAPLPIGDSTLAIEFDHPLSTFSTSNFQNWDFSFIPTSAYSDTFQIFMKAPANTPHAAQFPTANYCMNVRMYFSGSPFDVYLYGRNTNDSLWTMGIKYPDSTGDEIYSDPQVIYRFPFSFASTQQDSWTDINSGSSDSSKIKYEGWGTLKTAMGTYNNVVLFLDYFFNSNIGAWDIDQYRWVSLTNLMDILVIDNARNSGTLYNWNNTATSIAQEQLAKKYQFTVYPNPGKDVSYIAFHLHQPTPIQLQLLSVDGKLSKTIISENLQSGSHQIPVNSKELPNGTYFVRATLGQEVVVTTLMVQN